MTRLLSPGTYGFDAVEPGDGWTTGEAEITAAMIDSFAEVSGDRFAIHMDDAAAQDYGFPGRVAHGLLVLSVVDGLKNGAAVQLDAVASLGWEWSFRRPVLVGDVLAARIEVLTKRATSRPDRGIVGLGFEVTNRSGETVQDGRNQLMVWRR